MIKQENWFMTFKEIPNPKIRLFCFHYAGGSASVFREWVKDIPNEVELIAIQLPGRENRFNEELLTDVFQVIDKLYLAFTTYINKPFIFFGHSMGSLLAFEFTRKLRKERVPQPKHLIISGTKPPNVLSEKQPIYNLPDLEFINELKKYNGIPRLLMENEEILNIFLPGLRADFTISQAYKYNDDEPLQCPITVMGGKEDDTFDGKSLFKWKEQTLSYFKNYLFPGDHFFIKSSYMDVITVVNQILQEIIYSNLFLKYR